MKNRFQLLLIVMFLISFYSCEKEDVTIEGWSPVYFDALDFSEISSQSPKSIIKQGKIVKVGDYLFINDIKEGIHVVDNTDPENPEYIVFWSIPGNQNFTISENILYADFGPHLIVINISDFYQIKFENYIENVFFENMKEQFPEEESGYFECVDPNKGLVKEWRLKTLTNPQCKLS